MKRFVFRYILPLIIIVSLAAGYEYFVGFPRKYDGKWVHRITKLNSENPFRREQIFYAYRAAGEKREINHGPFLTYGDLGAVIFSATYRDGKIDGIAVWSNQFGEKSHEVFYHEGEPYGWARYANGKLNEMTEDIFENGRRVASKSFSAGKYALNFHCGELINAEIDPSSGQLTHIPGNGKRACTP
jgi:hypothetical protein